MVVSCQPSKPKDVSASQLDAKCFTLPQRLMGSLSFGCRCTLQWLEISMMQMCTIVPVKLSLVSEMLPLF